MIWRAIDCIAGAEASHIDPRSTKVLDRKVPERPIFVSKSELNFEKVSSLSESNPRESFALVRENFPHLPKCLHGPTWCVWNFSFECVSNLRGSRNAKSFSFQRRGHFVCVCVSHSRSLEFLMNLKIWPSRWAGACDAWPRALHFGPVACGVGKPTGRDFMRASERMGGLEIKLSQALVARRLAAPR